MEWLLLLFIAPYLFLLLWIRKHLSKVKKFNGTGDSSVFVSVIVPCRNEEKNLPSLLESLSLQDYPSELFEIVVVDDNSTDKTSSIVSEYGSIHNLRLLKNSGRGKKAAIRTGVSGARGKFLVTTDADCMMKKGWLSTIAQFYTEYNPDLVICPVIIAGGKGFLQKFQELEFLSLQGITAGTALGGNPSMCNGANLAFTRKVYTENAGFLHDEIPSGDDVFLLHAAKVNKGNRIMWLESPEATVTTIASTSLRALFRQRMRWISKADSYSDMFTLILGFATFLAVALQATLLPVAIAVPALLPLFGAAFLIKSIPDLLILLNTSGRYGKKKLLAWFLPCQLVYPYYVMTVVFLQVGKSFKRQET